MIADVTTNLITNLILGSDWIHQNNVYILTPEKRIMIRSRGKEVSTPFIKPPLLNYSAILNNDITSLPFSKHMMNAKVKHKNETDILFEPNPRLQNKALFMACTLINVTNKMIRISITNATNRQQTLSKGTKLGNTTQISASISTTIPSNHFKERIPRGKACTELNSRGKGANILNKSESMKKQTTISYQRNHQCQECHRYFNTGNDLFKHLRNECYLDEIREQINKLTMHISDDKHREQITKILWKYGKLFDTRKPSKIDII